MTSWEAIQEMKGGGYVLKLPVWPLKLQLLQREREVSMNFVFGYFLKRHIEDAGVPRVRLPPPVCDGNGKLWMWELPSLPVGRWLASWAQWGVTAGHSMLREEGKRISPGRAEVMNLVGRDTDSLKSEGEKITNKKKQVMWKQSLTSSPLPGPKSSKLLTTGQTDPKQWLVWKAHPPVLFFCWGWHWMVWNIPLVTLGQPPWPCLLPASCAPPAYLRRGRVRNRGLEVVQALLSNS